MQREWRLTERRGVRRPFLALVATAALLAALIPGTAAVGEGERAGSGGSARATYVVQMALDPVVTYDGGVRGLAATAPGHGRKIDPSSSAVVDYVEHLRSRHEAALDRVGAGEPLYDYTYSFDGFAAELTGDQAAELATMPSVVAVTEDEMQTVTTSSTPSFLGLDAPGGLWEQLGGPDGTPLRRGAGEDVVIGVIDSGIWPTSGSFSDRDARGKLAYRPLRGFDGKCDSAETVGDESWDANLCNHKLVAARHFNAAWGGDEGVEAQRPWEFLSPRDYNGHGTHTASTSGGNHGVATTGPTAVFGSVSGIAPRARIAAYKALWSTEDGSTAGGFTSDLVAAIDQAVADGVDVINYSVSGSTANLLDPVQVSFLHAADAGVFVSASAGNGGPGSGTVAHPGPWLTTVAAGTHSRTMEGSVSLGNGNTYAGASVAASPVGPAPLVDSTAVGLPGVDATRVAQCYTAADNGGPQVLDPAKVEGKIVICDRGVTARVNKSRAVAEAGGVGMILANTDPNSLNPDFHAVPTVHLAVTDRAAVKAYAATDGATATINKATIRTDAPAPYTATFSSRGPSAAGAGDLLKPDLMAPGQDVLAAVAPPGNGGLEFNLYSGTSMSAPHVAGLAALLSDKYPDWSPMMVKSALMTTGSDVRDGDATDPSVIFSQGAGHVQPNSAADPGLVYDSDSDDWLAFLCGATHGVAPSVCDDLRESGHSLEPSDLNTASIGIGLLRGTKPVTREVTNVGDKPATYTASITGLEGIHAAVEPSTLRLAPGESASFTVTFTHEDAEPFTYVGGQLTWTDGTHEVRSPIVLRARTAGQEDWEARYDGPSSSFGVASDSGDDVLLHPDGTRLYVGATSNPPVPGTFVQDFVTAAYDPESGDPQWVVRYDGSGGGSDEPAGFAMSPDGDTVYAAGTSGADFVTIAYDGATGAELWQAKHDGPGAGSDHAEDVAVSPDGTKVFVTGSHAMGDGGRDFGTVAYDAATGAELWASHWDDPVHGGDYARAVAVSPDSSTVVVTGQSMGETGRSYDWGIAAYDAATGQQVWDAQHNGPASKGDIPNSLAVTDDGTVVVVGSVAGIGTATDWNAVGYDVHTGVQQWVGAYDGTGSTDIPRAVAVTPDDATVLVTGNSWGDGTHSDYATVAFDAATGERRWAARHNGSATNSLDIAWDLAITDDSTRVVVTGQTTEANSRSDYTTLAYDVATGEQVWSARYDATGSGDGASGVAVDTTSEGQPHVFVTGASAISYDPEFGLDANVDATTVAYLDPWESS